MATWVTHLMIADRVLEAMPTLDRRGFCVGSIAPDCNVENEDWTQFVPSRETTHWMSGDRKSAADCERFRDAYIARSRREGAADGGQELSFLLGYYAHLIADAEFQRFIDDAGRVASMWARIKAHPALSRRAEGLAEDWPSAKRLIGKAEIWKDIYAIEAGYLDGHPDSGYLTEILGLESFPDYIPYLPRGAIVRKIGVMGYMPGKEAGAFPFAAISGEEYAAFLGSATEQVIRGIERG